jgi:hypothetical protein
VKGSGYPLTRLSYAVTNPVPLDAQSRKDYANFVEVVATDGQVPGTRPGTLPPGYAPLPGSYQVAAVTAAAAIRNPPALPTAEEPSAAAPDTPVAGSTSAPDGGSVPAPDLAAVDGSVLAVGAPAAVVPGSVAPSATVAAPATTLVARVAQLAGPWALPAMAVAALVVGVAGRLVSLLGSRETDAAAR